MCLAPRHDGALESRTPGRSIFGSGIFLLTWRWASCRSSCTTSDQEAAQHSPVALRCMLMVAPATEKGGCCSQLPVVWPRPGWIAGLSVVSGIPEERRKKATTGGCAAVPERVQDAYPSRRGRGGYVPSPNRCRLCPYKKTARRSGLRDLPVSERDLLLIFLGLRLLGLGLGLGLIHPVHGRVEEVASFPLPAL